MITVFDSLIVQIVRLTVDSVIDRKVPGIPDFIFEYFEKFDLIEYLRSHIYVISAVLAVIAVLGALSRFCARVLNSRGSELFVEKIRGTLFSHIQKLPFSWHIKNQTGDIIQRCTSDVETVRSFVAEQLVELFRVIFIISFSVFLMFSMNVKLALISSAFIPIVFIYSTYFRVKIAEKFVEADESEGVLSTITQENLTGVRVVRAFAREKFEMDKFQKQNDIFTELWAKLGITMSWFWGIGDFVSYIQIFTVITFGILEAVNGPLTPGEFIAFISYNALIAWPVRSLGRILSEMSKAGVSLDRLNYIMDSKEEADKEGAVTPSMDGDIEFKNVNFSYSNNIPILKDISFGVKSGETFGILGGTGSGKSTLMHLLNRLYDLPPERGQITVGGVDIADMEAAWVRKNVGMVLQEPFLFSRTISENISLPIKHFTFSDIREAAKIASIDDEIASFKDGYDTIVGERGVTLSGGQKQRVAIARLLTQKTPIIVFDDSLSAVDTETDAKIRAKLDMSLKTSTVILISHRITTLMRADRVLVLQNGRVAEMGTPAELYDLGGIYRRIYDIQISSFTEGRDLGGEEK